MPLREREMDRSHLRVVVWEDFGGKDPKIANGCDDDLRERESHMRTVQSMGKFQRKGTPRIAHGCDGRSSCGELISHV